MGDMLSQAEINALLGAASDIDDTATEPGVSDAEGQSKSLPDTHSDVLSNEQKDVLGEIGNISMGTAATTLFALLRHKVTINTPRVHVMAWSDLPSVYDRPCVGVRVDYKEGLQGANILILKQRDVKIITSLMMGGDGGISEDVELSEIDLSAIGEAMNQMVGSSSTSLSAMIKTKIDIDTPHAFVLDFDTDDFFQTVGFKPEDIIVCVSFTMKIGDLIDSEIMQILPKDFAVSVVETLKKDISGTPRPDPAPAAGQPAPPLSENPAPRMQAPPPVQAPPPMSQQQYAPPPPIQQNINVQPVQFQNFDVNAVMQQKENIDIIMDVPLEVTVELGRTRKKIKEILEFSPGTVIELDKLAGEPIDVLVNGKFVAKGEVVVIDENFGVRITTIISPENRI